MTLEKFLDECKAMWEACQNSSYVVCNKRTGEVTTYYAVPEVTIIYKKVKRCNYVSNMIL